MALDVALVALLIVLNAAFAGSELALVSLREGQLRRLEQRGDRGRRVAQLARDPNRFLATVQVGITLAGFLASATAAVSLAEPLVDPLGFLGRMAEPVAIVLVTLVLTFFTLVLGELAPKRVALQRAERWALVAAPPISRVAQLTRPMIWLLARSTDVAVRLLGGDPSKQREDVSEEEFRDLLATTRRFSPSQRRIIAGALDIAERPLQDVLVPRRDVVAVEAHTPAFDALEILRCSGHARAPVFTNDLDDASGIVHLLDLLGAKGSVAELARPALVLPESIDVLQALRQLQAKRESMAIVTNEFGGIEGIVTVEDLLEEIVGEIYDENDRDIRAIRRESDGSLLLAGSFPVHDLEDIDVQLPEGDYSTVAGLVLDRLGHLPDVGEAVEVNGWRIDVVAVNGRAIERVRLRRHAESR
jgi:putative hemolysin